MVDQKGFTDRGNWYKGNLHSHTINSDGIYSPQMAKEEFMKHGYSFLCLSDHNLYTDYRESLNSGDFIVLPGLEAAAVLFDENMDCVKVHHINGILGTKQMQERATLPLFGHMEKYGPYLFYGSWDEEAAAQRIIDELHNKGCFVTYNHPVWSRIDINTLHLLKDIDLLEIFNYNTENESGTGFITSCWDQMLRAGMKQKANASDDNHNGGTFDDAFGGFIMVNARCLQQDAIVSAILEGNYYSSSGPFIKDWGIRDNKIYFSCEPVERINIIADGFVGSGVTFIAKDGESLTDCEYLLTGKEHYVRIECMDRKGRKAWTNPIYIK